MKRLVNAIKKVSHNYPAETFLFVLFIIALMIAGIIFVKPLFTVFMYIVWGSIVILGIAWIACAIKWIINVIKEVIKNS